MNKNALVIGKFYPPHAGHRHLIETAEAEAEHVYVLVQGSRFESLTVETRAAWLKEEFDGANVTIVPVRNDCPVDYASDEIWTAQMENMRWALKVRGVEKIDAVYSSESYGARLAEAFGAIHVAVDPQRRNHHISGTACRDDLAENWQQIIPAARCGMAVRVIVVGAESTGTTTLSKALSEHYRPQFPALVDVPEYGRHYTYELLEALQRTNPDAAVEDLVWTDTDFAVIAARQTEMEQAAAESAPLVIADTDALATTLWERYYLGEGSYGSFGALDRLPHRDVYLLTDHTGVDFEDDGWREGEHRRPEMTEWFKEALTEEGHSWILVTGSRERRLATATAVIDAILAQQAAFTSPVWAGRTVLEQAA
ncbi:nicotinamide-nucleotide adenylyltransferase, NadR type [Arthrobacter alpinus]|uniref:Nicotinamide-nucleotide adenylyltransferase, NadR type n=1 Tax=Arthrobacter alpinus TaxID=656366 RepID=A0A1H5NCJ4_9MICC|nr:AAA family ATPase [Arthrobacter alpinus]SEE99200.1 nicotinamide-nucleotide adenylyltransferase, NadR type [Arthrobacter alpinus]